MSKNFLAIVSPKARITFLLSVLACLFVAGFLFTQNTFAQAPPVAENYGLDSGFTSVGVQTDTDLKSIIASIINIVFGFLGILAVILIIYAGYLWLTAGGNSEQVEQAKKILQGAVIGLAIILSAWGIAAFIIRQLSDATGTSGGPGGGGTILPPDGTVGAFVVQSIETSHLPGPSNQDVYRCSKIQPQFNHYINSAKFESLKGGETLTVKKETSPGVFVNEGTVEVSLRNNVISFKRTDGQGKWGATSDYEVRLDETLENTRTQQLSTNCADCDGDRDGYNFWSFSTGTIDDEDDPTLDMTYPTTGDTSVPLSTIFSLEFSEAIDIESVVTVGGELEIANIALQRKLPGGSFEAAIPGNAFDVSLSGSNIQFALNENHVPPSNSFFNQPGVLEPYTEYKLTIQNIEDLCGRGLSAIQTITFETGADLPGVKFVRPSDGYQYSCPSTDVFAMFKTSMYDVRNQDCAVDPTGRTGGPASGAAGLVLGGVLNPGSILLKSLPEDNYIAGVGNPNDFCKKYNFDLDTVDLNVNTSYSAEISFIEPGGDVSSPTPHTWEFDVAEPGSCVEEPYITRLSPNNGKWGRCLSVIGRNFDSPQAAGSVVSTSFDLDSILNQQIYGSFAATSLETYWQNNTLPLTIDSWADRIITADFISAPPAVNLPPFVVADSRIVFKTVTKVYKGSPINDFVYSNPESFIVDRNGVFNGPCLSGIVPDEGYWGDEVKLKGRNLDHVLATDVISFNPSSPQITQNPAEVSLLFTPVERQSRWPVSLDPWGDNEVVTKLPNYVTDGLVTITIDGETSNAVAFKVDGIIGEACSTLSSDFPDPDPVAAICTSPENSVCRDDLECSPNTCLCESPDRFRIISASPSNQCEESCPNSVVSFTTNKPIGSLSGKVDILECTDADCTSGTTITPTSITNTVPEVAVIDMPLAVNTWYKIDVHGDLESATLPIRELHAGSYTWKFQTRSTQCNPDRVEVSPNDALLYETRDYTFKARAFAPADNCSGNGQELVAGGSFTWKDVNRINTDPVYDCDTSSDQSLIAITPSASTAESTASVDSFPANDRTDRYVWVCAEYSGIKNGAAATLRPECRTSVASDCEVSNVDGSCTASCVEGVCAPKITSLSPTNGKPGTWVTVNGCFLGNDWGKVKVKNTEAVKPDEIMCGNTWTNTQVVAEVDAATSMGVGSVEVIRTGDNSNVISSSQFVVDSITQPGICKLSPVRGKKNSVVDIKGQNLGAYAQFTAGPASSYNTTLIDSATTNFQIVDVVGPEIKFGCPAGGWKDDHICMRVANNPAPSLGIGQIKVISNTSSSNLVSFTVLDPNIRPANAVDMFIKEFSPGVNASACPNMLVDVELRGELDIAEIGVGLDVELDSPAIAFSNFFVEDSGGARLEGIIKASSDAAASKIQFQPKRPLAFGDIYKIVLDTDLKTASGGDIGSNTGDACEALGASTLTNGNMEQGAPAATPSLWDASNTTITKDTGIKRDGVGSMKIVKNADDAYAQHSTALVGDGETYKVSGYSFIPSTNGVNFTYIAIYNIDRNEVMLKTDMARVGSWQEHSFYLKTKVGENYKVKLGVEGGNTNFAYFDDVTFRKVEDITRCEIDFNVVDAEEAANCFVDRLSINPVSPVISCAGRNNCSTDDNSAISGNQETFFAELVSRNNQPIISPIGMVAYWSFNNEYVNGDTILDQSGNNFNATIDPAGGATSGVLGKSGEAISFRGNNFNDTVKGLMNHEFEDEVTLSLWFKSGGGGQGSPRILEFSDSSGGSSRSTLLGYHSSGSLRTHVTCEADNNRYGEITSPSTYIADAWHHAVYTYSNSDGAKLYVDSVEVGSASGGCSNIYGAKTFSIGNYYPVSDHDFKGLIDEVRIYDRALSEFEVMNLYLVPGPNYTWETSDPSIMSLAGTSNTDSHYYTAEPINGSSIITSTIDGSNITGSTEARVFMCINPWPASMSNNGVSFNDKTGDSTFTNQSPKTNFSTFYCRDRGDENSTDDDLPMLPIGNASFGGNCAGGPNNENLCNTDTDCAAPAGRCIKLTEFGSTSGAGSRTVPGLLKETFFIQPWSKACTKGDDDKIGNTCASGYDCGTGGECVSPVDGGGIDVMSVRVLGVNWCAGIDPNNTASCVDDTDCGGAAGSCVTNPEYFSVRNWYDSQGYTEGSPTSISVDEFDALQDGRTIYVNAPNSSASTIYNNIYLISINDKAHEDSVNIYNQLVENWRFLANIDTGEVEKIRRDLQRVNSAYFAADLIQRTQFPVELEAGTLQKGMSLSTWPSWSQTLGPLLSGSISIDPKENKIVCESKPGLDQTTCWDPSVTLPNPQYQCDIGSDSQFYLYRFDESSNTATFGFNLEHSANWNNVFVGPGWGGSTGLSCINNTYQRTYP
jgi:hypothetical protein